MAEILAKMVSNSNPGKTYEITLGADDIIYCTCWGWKKSRWCKHLSQFEKEKGVSIKGKPTGNEYWVAIRRKKTASFFDPEDSLSPRIVEQEKSKKLASIVEQEIRRLRG